MPRRDRVPAPVLLRMHQAHPASGEGKALRKSRGLKQAGEKKRKWTEEDQGQGGRDQERVTEGRRARHRRFRGQRTGQRPGEAEASREGETADAEA